MPKALSSNLVNCKTYSLPHAPSAKVLTKLPKAGRKGEQGNDQWNKSREVVMQKTGKSSCEKCKARIDRPPPLSNRVFRLLGTRINIRGKNFSFCYQTRFEGYSLGTGLIVGLLFQGICFPLIKLFLRVLRLKEVWENRQ